MLTLLSVPGLERGEEMLMRRCAPVARASREYRRRQHQTTIWRLRKGGDGAFLRREGRSRCRQDGTV